MSGLKWPVCLPPAVSVSSSVASAVTTAVTTTVASSVPEVDAVPEETNADAVAAAMAAAVATSVAAAAATATAETVQEAQAYATAATSEAHAHLQPAMRDLEAVVVAKADGEGRRRKLFVDAVTVVGQHDADARSGGKQAQLRETRQQCVVRQGS